MGNFKITYVDSILHEIIVEAETKEDASYKLPAWKPEDGYPHIKSIEPFIEEYEITYEHGDRHKRKTDTVKVKANSIQEVRVKTIKKKKDKKLSNVINMFTFFLKYATIRIY